MNVTTEKPASLWLNGENINSQFKPKPHRFVATIEARCNLACNHCYWAHDINVPSVKDWTTTVARITNYDAPVFYAGRMLTKAGASFLRECVNQNIDISIVDNGYTILNYSEFLPKYQNIDISIDGDRDAHDIQRGKTGAFSKAWKTVLELKRQGFDPTIAAAFSPLSFNGWERFEQLLAEHDTPLSSTLVWSLPETKKRGTAVIEDKDILRAFEKLSNGIPKLINVYAREHVMALDPIFKSLKWGFSSKGDGFLANIGDTIIYYRPTSLSALLEAEVLWDGDIYTPIYVTRGTLPSGDFSANYLAQVQKIRKDELELCDKFLTLN